MYRDAESQFRSSLKHFSRIDMFLFLGKVYVKLDQPLSALDYYKRVSSTPYHREIGGSQMILLSLHPNIIVHVGKCS